MDPKQLNRLISLGAIFASKLLEKGAPPRKTETVDPDTRDAEDIARILRAIEAAGSVLETTGKYGPAFRAMLSDLRNPAMPSDEIVSKILAELKDI